MLTQLVIETPTGYMIQCRACGWHEFPKIGKPGASWKFNGNVFSPSFTPSMNQTFTPTDPDPTDRDMKFRRCHFIVTAGTINYCGDCTHAYAGQRFPLEPWPEAKVKYYDALKGQA